jgi:hypothetical protein
MNRVLGLLVVFGVAFIVYNEYKKSKNSIQKVKIK